MQAAQALGARAVALQLDIGDSASFSAFATAAREALHTHWHRERFDYLLNNAGVGVNANFVDTTEAQFDQMVRVHLNGPFLLTQALLPLMQDGGRILNVSSGLARFSMPGYAAYAAMKGGIEVLTRYLALELGPRRIAVNTIAPGAIATDFGGGTVRDNAQVNSFHRLPDRTGPGGRGRRHRQRDARATLGRHGLGQRPAARSVGRYPSVTSRHSAASAFTMGRRSLSFRSTHPLLGVDTRSVKDRRDAPIRALLLRS